MIVVGKLGRIGMIRHRMRILLYIRIGIFRCNRRRIGARNLPWCDGLFKRGVVMIGNSLHTEHVNEDGCASGNCIWNSGDCDIVHLLRVNC